MQQLIPIRPVTEMPFLECFSIILTVLSLKIFDQLSLLSDQKSHTRSAHFLTRGRHKKFHVALCLRIDRYN